MTNPKQIRRLGILWLLSVLLWLCVMIELTTIVSYRHCFTAGELFAWVTANGYEVSDIAGYCMRYVLPYWIVCTLIFGLVVWGTYWCVKKNLFWQCGAIIVLLLLPFVFFPFSSNLVRESSYVYRQIRNIYSHKNDSKSFSYNANRKDFMAQKEIYVLSIGESVRYQNWSLNGTYPRQTTPLLAQQSNLCLYSDYYADATLTQHAIPLLFTPATADNFNDHFHYKSIAAAFREVGFKTVLVSHRAQLMNNGYHDYLAQDFDSIVFVEHDSLIASSIAELAQQEHKLFIVAHYLGNHMFYTNRTEDCLVWRPDYNADSKVRSDSLFLNAYDNSLLYTDRLLKEVISVLDSTNTVCSWLFISDHGEYISPHVSGHGHTYYPVKEEYHVPLMVWCSDEYVAACPDKVTNMVKHKQDPVCADHIFWSVLDMAGVEIQEMKQNASIFGENICTQKRQLLLPDGKSIMQL